MQDGEQGQRREWKVEGEGKERKGRRKEEKGTKRREASTTWGKGRGKEADIVGQEEVERQVDEEKDRERGRRRNGKTER